MPPNGASSARRCTIILQLHADSQNQQKTAGCRAAEAAGPKALVLCAVTADRQRKLARKPRIVNSQMPTAKGQTCRQHVIADADGRHFPCTQVSEERLIELLEQVNQQAGAGKTRVTIQRRRTALGDDDF